MSSCVKPHAYPARLPPEPLPSLGDTLASLGCLGELEVEVGEQTEGWYLAAELAEAESVWRDAFLRMESELYPGLDEKGQWAFLLSNVSYFISLILAGLYLGGRQVPQLMPGQLALRVKMVEWHEDGDSGSYPQPCFRFLTPAFWTDTPGKLPDSGRHIAGEEALRLCLRQQLELFFEPVIAQMNQRCRLSKGAGWRLIADSIAAAFLAAGRELGCEARAKEEALALIKSPDSPLYNRQTGFFEIQLVDPSKPDTPLLTQSFRSRGGCCRYYTADGGRYCSTCVLEKAPRRDQRLREHLWQCYQEGLKV